MIEESVGGDVQNPGMLLPWDSQDISHTSTLYLPVPLVLFLISR
jgi:hypothetical protein